LTITGVVLKHNHAGRSLSEEEKEEAIVSIRLLEKEVLSRALTQLQRIKGVEQLSAAKLSLAIKLQTQVLEDVEFALGKEKFEKLKRDAARAQMLLVEAALVSLDLHHSVR
jgi:hypothetical protein